MVFSVMDAQINVLIQSDCSRPGFYHRHHDIMFEVGWYTLKDIDRKLASSQNNLYSYRVIIRDINENNSEVVRKMIVQYPEVCVFFSQDNWMDLLLEHITGVNYDNIPKSDLLIMSATLDRLNSSRFRSHSYKWFRSRYCKEIEDASKKYSFYEKLLKDINNEKTLRTCLFYISKMSVERTMHYLPIRGGSLSDENYERLELSNLFDASNLRYAVKSFIFYKKHMMRNIAAVLDTRARNIAYIVDEESEQSFRLSYYLYANGMRSFPVNTQSLLLYASELWKAQQNKIILRDFDLQFRDETSKKKCGQFNEIDFIRGYKYIAQEKKWLPFVNASYCCPINCSSQSCDHNLYYWHEDDLRSVYCVSQGYHHLRIGRVFLFPIKQWKIRFNDKELFAPGIKKPVTGIYRSLEKIKEVKKTRKCLTRLDGADRSRFGNTHSAPLGLYDIVLPIYERAKCYFKEGEYILSAVLSQEAIELLNGFHAALSLQAFHIHAMAENAIAMNNLGSQEKTLEEDCVMRIDLIRKTVRSMVKGTTFDEKNILNQIYSDCRLYCREKEHFQSEEVFLDAMAKLNDGGPCPLFKKFKSLFVE